MASNDFISTLDEVAASADSVHEHVLRLHDAVESLESLDTDLPAIDSAQLYASLALAMATLYYGYLRSRGITTETHPYHQDLTRLKLYLKKVIEKVHSNKDDNASSGPGVARHIDKKVAKRIVRFYTQNTSANL